MPVKKVGTNREILDQLALINAKVTVTDEKVTSIRTVLDGAAEQDKPGLMERVRQLEKLAESIKRLMWIIVGIILTDVVTRLWSIIVK